MKKNICLLTIYLIMALNGYTQSFITLFEKTNGGQTPGYYDVIEFYQRLDKASDKLLLKKMGMSDAGLPLHLALFSNSGVFDPVIWHQQNKSVILINNGIHAGEPDGIDASMLLLRDLVTGRKKITDNVVLAFIPVYNIGGSLNRSGDYRVDQNGPAEFGSRGNSQNLDLNRDFIKCDSREARSFAEIFHYLDPDIFVDNHVSNGADYQHIITLLSSQHSKLGASLGDFMNKVFEPALYTSMKQKGYDLVPYVNFFGETPGNGWPEFFDSPRYSSGYAALWNTFGFITETHMLKPYRQRVESTYALMESFIEFAGRNSIRIRSLRMQAKKDVQVQLKFPVRWELDSSRFSMITFKGFEDGKKPSGISGLPRLFYDRNKPFEKKVKFYNYYNPIVNIERPAAYIIPQGWWKVIDLLKINNVRMTRLQKDSILEVQAYQIDSYRASPVQFEMHHLNSEVMVRSTYQSLRFRKGDYIIPMNQPSNRFVVEVLEPQGHDSYFAWNFFDSILDRKEGYSNYMFEDTAEELLKKQPALLSKLNRQRMSDTAFAKDGRAQLDFIFENSPYFDREYLRFPVYRIN